MRICGGKERKVYLAQWEDVEGKEILGVAATPKMDYSSLIKNGGTVVLILSGKPKPGLRSSAAKALIPPISAQEHLETRTCTVRRSVVDSGIIDEMSIA